MGVSCQVSGRVLGFESTGRMVELSENAAKACFEPSLLGGGELGGDDGIGEVQGGRTEGGGGPRGGGGAGRGVLGGGGEGGVRQPGAKRPVGELARGLARQGPGCRPR